MRNPKLKFKLGDFEALLNQLEPAHIPLLHYRCCCCQKVPQPCQYYVPVEKFFAKIHIACVAQKVH